MHVMPDYRDPKEARPGASWAGYPENTTGDVPPAAGHIEAIAELDSLRTCCRALLEDRNDETAWEWLEELLARENGTSA